MPLTEHDLAHFTGTEQYHRWSGLFRRHLLTDGANYVAEQAGAFWLFDAIASYHGKIMKHADSRLRDFQIWRLETKNNSAVLTCWADTGKGERHKIRQVIEYTDFPLPLIEFYVEPTGDGQFVILLKSEH